MHGVSPILVGHRFLFPRDSGWLAYLPIFFTCMLFFFLGQPNIISVKFGFLNSEIRCMAFERLRNKVLNLLSPDALFVPKREHNR